MTGSVSLPCPARPPLRLLHHRRLYMCPRYSLELGGEEGSLLNLQTATATARAEIHWDEASTYGGKSEEELEMTEGEDNVELSGNSGLYCAMTGNLVH